MTAGSPSQRPDKLPNETSRAWFDHSSADRVNTDAVLVRSLRAEYPDLHLTVVPVFNCNVLEYASSPAANAGVAPIDREKDRLSWREYTPPASRLTGKGALSNSIKFGKYLLDWRNKEFVIFVAEARDGTSYFPALINQYILSPSVDAVNALLIEAGQYGNLLHNEVWVFDGGAWQKSAELWDSVQKARWEDVILDSKMKKMIIGDVNNFFESRATYEKLRVPWKRGIIYYGPPGNGKTISIKAMMHDLYERKDPVPTLYVRTLASFAGPEYSLRQIFTLARRTAPCLLVFEDLDSIVSDSVRSYFLNEVDGIKKNDGILIIGSTNHLDRLDPGIVKRPSRFDRKYEFHNPNEEERILYMQYWQGKLSDNNDVEFPNKLCPAVAKITKGFSFAYLQEAMVAALLALARDEDKSSDRVCLECLDAHAKPANGSTCDRTNVRSFNGLYNYVGKVRMVDEDDADLDNYPLWRELKKQVRILREEMSEDRIMKR